MIENHLNKKPELRDFFINRFAPIIEEVVDGKVNLWPSPTQGNLNYSFLISSTANNTPRWLLRIKDLVELEHTFSGPPNKVYQKERTIQTALRDLGVLAAEPIGPIWEIPDSFCSRGPFVASMQSYISAKDGTQFAPRGSEAELELIREIGRLAKPLAQITFENFGEHLSENGQFSLSWEKYIDELTQFSVNNSCSVLGQKLYNNFIKKIDILKNSEVNAQLVHADLHTSNALFDDLGCGKVLVDWERSRASIVEEEFARILYENFVLGQRYKEKGVIEKLLISKELTPQFAAFLDGYGISTSRYDQIYRERTELFLTLLCVGFLTRYEMDYKHKRPDWAIRAGYAREAAEALLNNYSVFQKSLPKCGF